MKILTKKSMKKVITFVLTVFLVALMTGCDQGEQNNNQPQDTSPETQEQKDGGINDQDALSIKFDLPDEWKWSDKKTLEAIWEETAKGGNAPFVKLEFGGMEKGTAEEAGKRVAETYEEQKNACTAAGIYCPSKPELEQFQIAGIDVSTAMYVGYVWGKPSWNSHIAFEKNGYVIELMLYDKATLHQSELKTIISSMSW